MYLPPHCNCLRYGIKYRDASTSCPPLPGVTPATTVSGLWSLMRTEPSFPSCDTLNNDPRVLIYEYAPHHIPPLQLPQYAWQHQPWYLLHHRCAAKEGPPFLLLVPTSRTTTGRSRSTLSMALMRPCAASSPGDAAELVNQNDNILIHKDEFQEHFGRLPLWHLHRYQGKFMASPPSAICVNRRHYKACSVPITPISPFSFT